MSTTRFTRAGLGAVLFAAAILTILPAPAQAAPLAPAIEIFDFNFGATFQYATNGISPDTLTTTFDPAAATAPAPGPSEVTALFPLWPATAPSLPVWYDDGVANGASLFGGDLVLDLVFDAHDEVPPHLDVSITGTGANQDPGSPDLLIFGNYIGLSPTGDPTNTALFGIDVQVASLYGYSDSESYVLELAGTIVVLDQILLDAINEQRDDPYDMSELLGQSAVARGHIDIPETPDVFPVKYDPLVDYSDLYPDAPTVFNGTYSGETGPGQASEPVPEPVTVAMLGLGGLGFFAAAAVRRRRRI
jgi:hypothetical protein